MAPSRAQVLQLVRFPTMSQAELCLVGDHPLVGGDPKVQVRPAPAHAHLHVLRMRMCMHAAP